MGRDREEKGQAPLKEPINKINVKVPWAFVKRSPETIVLKGRTHISDGS